MQGKRCILGGLEQFLISARTLLYIFNHNINRLASQFIARFLKS